MDQAGERLGALASLLTASERSLGAVAKLEQQKAGAAPRARTVTAEETLAASAQREDRSYQEYNARSQIADYARNLEPRAAPVQAPAISKDASSAEVGDLADTVRDEAATAGAGDDEGSTLASRRAISAASASEARVPTGPIRVGSFDPVWLAGEELALVREVSVDGVSYREGVWVDWAALRSELLAAQADLFPGSSLEPILDAEAPTDPADAARRLATIPVRYTPGGAVVLARAGMTPARWSLLVTWVAVLAAVAAIGVVLHASIQLSERRGKFVSAVTHELRTPLTTFRLYAQMLADGMVTDEGARAEYLSTLKRESGRLSGIVENVLEYARLSRRAAGRPKAVGPISPESLLVRLRPTLSRRAEQGGMDLIVSADLEAAAGRVVHVDPQSVERILTNLIDNACKYAAPEGAEDADTRIHLDVRAAGDELEMLVADYGAGVGAADRGRIFGEFRRGAGGERADRSGLGLGLALSRGLAREAEGDLRLVRRRGHGAEFLLTLPLHAPGGG
ncbi:MAG: HAMP domain-containing sensor histidine kinase [Phycisphaerales bacterium]